MLLLFSYYSSLSQRLITLQKTTVRDSISWIAPLPKFYKTNDLMWQDGLLIDFLQKKVVDKWIRRFLVHSSYIFNERSLFEFVVKFYIDTIIWPFSKTAVFDFSNVSWILLGLISGFIVLVLLLTINYIYIIILLN